MTKVTAPLDLDAAYPRVQLFYAAQLRMLDELDVQGYAATFTPDAEFAHTPGQPPARTRGGILAELIEAARRFATDPVQRRHWVNMIHLTPADDGALISHAYCLVVKIRPGQQPTFVSCVMHDVLVEGDAGLLTRSRVIEYD